MGDYQTSPVTLRTASVFVTEHHRHNVAPQGHRASVGITRDGVLVGVVIVGRPISRHLDDGTRAEIIRVCVMEGHPNASSYAFAAGRAIGRALGYRTVITYTLSDEPGTSLRAAGFREDGKVRARETWACTGRAGGGERPTCEKTRWVWP